MMKKATKQDITQIMKIIKSVVIEMKLTNNTQWDDHYPTDDDFSRDIEAGTLYIVEDNGCIKGLICLDFNQPKAYESMPWKTHDTALVIHRMAVNPNFRNQGIARLMLTFAEGLMRNKNLTSIRTDTYSLNKKMMSLFLSAGYTYVGEMDYKDKPYKYVCYEKQISI